MAISRMRSMLSVGVFEERRDSWRAIAAAMSADLNQPGYLVRKRGGKVQIEVQRMTDGDQHS